ncbi:MAG: chemotaxis protein CheW [Gammaproteobacteria bacterium CG22_combo_CG10-13_8_21_14_all_40_8]|nr:MAG: chemotaxis protein CheW [Gammaproteobacteria bacterium CG22_combo_CG10-13_8_21_14_all_40_8]
MAGVLDGVNQRTQMVGQNRLELLLFKLAGKQIYGINVFKVREVLQCPPLTQLPNGNPVVRGVAHIRGETVSVVDLSMAIGGPMLPNISNCFVVISEYNRKVQGFLVNSVERIVNMSWGDIHPPPKGVGKNNYLTAVSEFENGLIEIIDVEKVLSEIIPTNETVSTGLLEESHKAPQDKVVLVADDSAVARNQVKRTVEQLGLKTHTVINGKEALDWLLGIVKQGKNVNDEVLLVISDIEMPEMDGYTFTAEVRANPDLSDLHIILHTSLSGVFNKAMIEKVGANKFIAKFDPNELAAAVRSQYDQ